MTSSKFSTPAKVKLPPQCHKQLDGLQPDYATGEPNILSAVAIWKNVYTSHVISESFDLFFGPAPNSWTGWSAQLGLNLAVNVFQHGTTDVFTFELYLRNGLAVIDIDNWTSIPLDPRPPFNSGLLQHPRIPPNAWTQLEVTD